MVEFDFDPKTRIWTYKDEKKVVMYNNDDKRIVKQACKSLEDEISMFGKAVKVMFELDYKKRMKQDYNDTIYHPNLEYVDRNPLTISGLVFSYNNLDAKEILFSGDRFDLPKFYNNLGFMKMVLEDKENQVHMIRTAKFDESVDWNSYFRLCEENSKRVDAGMMNHMYGGKQ